MSDLTEWLLACIAEDESVARAVAAERVRDTGPSADETVCKAHREIVEAAREYSPELEHGDNGEWAFDFTVRTLATIYADRPGYREEWAL